VGPPQQVGTATTPPPALSATDNFQVLDEAAQAAFQTPGAPYPGPIAGIQNEYININTTNLDITAITPNAFIQTGSGNDTLQAYFGRNVLDAGGGSNVMIGGIGGTDTFIANISEAGSNSLTDLIKDFHINDDVVIQGLSPSTFSISTSTSVGAFGQQLEIDAVPNGGGPTSSISIAGYSANDIGGKLSISFSQDPSGNPFMLVHANG
jgi:Ca2+-binding RTX toxin-like protein